MSLRLESRLPPLLLWPSWIWVFVAAEMLLLLWARFTHCHPDLSLEVHRWQRSFLFGADENHNGVVFSMAVVNTVVVLGLWISYRSARRFHRHFRVPVAFTTLAAALVLATMTWSAVSLKRDYPPLNVHGILELDSEGSYTVRE